MGLATVFGCLFALVIIFGLSCLMGWLVMVCAGMFGLKWPFWGCVLGWFLVGSLFQAARNGGKD